MQQALESKLLAAFAPARLEVVNESDSHSGPPNRESHFKVVLVGDAFAPLSRVARHRAVNKVLADELAAGLHALSIFAWSLQEWAERGGEIPASPLCRGGDKGHG